MKPPLSRTLHWTGISVKMKRFDSLGVVDDVA